MKPKLMQKSDASKSNALEYDGVSVGRIAYISCCEHFVSVFIEKKERRNINMKNGQKWTGKALTSFPIERMKERRFKSVEEGKTSQNDGSTYTWVCCSSTRPSFN